MKKYATKSKEHTMIKKFLIKLPSFFLCSLLISLTSCYSFTGSSLSPETKTIQINDFPNNPALVNPNLAQQFSTDIQNRFLQRTTLKGTKASPDILIEGEITDYQITPTTISSAVNTGGGTIQAVSYTHLDVYKRQWQNTTISATTFTFRCKAVAIEFFN